MKTLVLVPQYRHLEFFDIVNPSPIHIEGDDSTCALMLTIKNQKYKRISPHGLCLISIRISGSNLHIRSDLGTSE